MCRNRINKLTKIISMISATKEKKAELNIKETDEGRPFSVESTGCPLWGSDI